MTKKLTKLEKRLLYNFVMGERNRITYPDIDGLKKEYGALSIEVKFSPCPVNLNNFDGDMEKYKKALDKLVKKL